MFHVLLFHQRDGLYDRRGFCKARIVQFRGYWDWRLLELIVRLVLGGRISFGGRRLIQL
jgi:hypothetical protein